MPNIRTIKKNSGPNEPQRVVGETHRSIARELHPTGGRDKTNTSPSSNRTFAFTCSVCGNTSKASLVRKTRAIDEGRRHRGCESCGAPKGRVIYKSGKLSAELQKQVVPNPKLTSVNQLRGGMKELRLWKCSCVIEDGIQTKPFIYAASVAARTLAKDPQGCPRCSELWRIEKENKREFAPYLKMLVRQAQRWLLVSPR